MSGIRNYNQQGWGVYFPVSDVYIGGPEGLCSTPFDAELMVLEVARALAETFAETVEVVNIHRKAAVTIFPKQRE